MHGALAYSCCSSSDQLSTLSSLGEMGGACINTSMACHENHCNTMPAVFPYCAIDCTCSAATFSIERMMANPPSQATGRQEIRCQGAVHNRRGSHACLRVLQLVFTGQARSWERQ